MRVEHPASSRSTSVWSSIESLKSADNSSVDFTISSLSDTDICSLPDWNNAHDHSDSESDTLTTITPWSSVSNLSDDLTFSDISSLDSYNLSSDDDDSIVDGGSLIIDRANESMLEAADDLSEHQHFIQGIAHSLLDAMIAEVALALAEKKIVHKPPTGKKRMRKAVF